MILAAHGLGLELPRGWSGRIFRRPGGIATLHAGDFAVALDDGEFGGRSTSIMPAPGTFVSLTEYAPGHGLKPGAGLFAARWMTLPLDPTSFGPRRLAHPRPGQIGTQQFFTASGRPMCLYVVLSGPRARRRHQLAILDQTLANFHIESRAAR